MRVAADCPYRLCPHPHLHRTHTHTVTRTHRAEVAIKGGSAGLQKFVGDMRAQLTQMCQSDFTGHALLQLKKQALVRRLVEEMGVVGQRWHVP